MNTKVSAKDFFLHLGAIIVFYASVIGLITLLFEIINYAYPQVTNFYQPFPSISFQVATLIVAAPLFLFLSWILQRTYAKDPSVRELPIRKWLAYITLFVAGAVIAGDLVTVIYRYLDGQELTTGFLLKVLVLFVIAGGVFTYYLREIRDLISGRERNTWRMAAVIIVIASIVLGFAVIGSPRDQRERRYDSQRVSDLQSIQWQIVNNWQQRGVLPQTLEELSDPISGYTIPTDPETGEPYEYARIDGLTFELCATFDRESQSQVSPSVAAPIRDPFHEGGNNWQHDAGRECFTRTIDPELYPVRPR